MHLIVYKLNYYCYDVGILYGFYFRLTYNNNDILDDVTVVTHGSLV